MKKTFYLLLIIIFSISSCKKVNKIEKVIINSVKAPLSGEINKDIEFELTFSVNNGCGQFNRFIEYRKGKTVFVEIEAKYVGDACTMDIPLRTVTYVFKTFISGEYYFKFKTGKEIYTTKTINILY